MNWGVIVEHLPLFGQGVLTSLLLLGASTLLGLLLSIPLAVMRVSRTPWLAGPVAAFTFVIRGTPAMVQLFMIYYGLSQFEAVRASMLWPWLSNATFCVIICQECVEPRDVFASRQDGRRRQSARSAAQPSQ
jgi:arginine/ornithine transport system permease protein